ncbi:MAG: SIMPL domain-containing protein [Nanoarchaeota archaeon]|nr:SIMPL domain-containing protein [Nanoarchaeota archaeon]
MKKSTLSGIVLIIIVLAIAIIGVTRLGGFVKNEQKTIDVTGSSTISKLPDKAILSIGVETQGENANSAENENTVITNNIYDSLESLGLTSEDYKTQSFNIYPNKDWENNGEILSYTVNHMILIDTDKIDLIPEILDLVVDAGANNIYGIDFTLKEETKELAKAEAYEKATEYARIKAESIAKGLGVEINDIVSVSDTSYDFGPFRTTIAVAEIADQGSNIQLESGDVEVTSSVSVSYGFK